METVDSVRMFSVENFPTHLGSVGHRELWQWKLHFILKSFMSQNSSGVSPHLSPLLPSIKSWKNNNKNQVECTGGEEGDAHLWFWFLVPVSC